MVFTRPALNQWLFISTSIYFEAKQIDLGLVLTGFFKDQHILFNLDFVKLLTFLFVYFLTVSCAAGYKSNVGGSQCDKCATGTYQPNPDQTTCINCNAGTWTEDDASTSVTQCISMSGYTNIKTRFYMLFLKLMWSCKTEHPPKDISYHHVFDITIFIYSCPTFIFQIANIRGKIEK